MAVFGATGYIGKYVARELIARGYDVVVFARSQSGIGGKASQEDTVKAFQDADVRFGDVTDVQSLSTTVFSTPVDVVISCLASRTGGKKDSWLVDYQATSNVLQAARTAGAQHFVLLSAICVQKPQLEFQKAKLKFEEELMSADDITYSIVRPTAFFKSLAGQVELVKDGKPFVMFGDGELASCKPISEADLASFMADCIEEQSKVNQILPIGGMEECKSGVWFYKSYTNTPPKGPGKALSAKEQGEMLFRLANKPENFFPVPIALMDGICGFLDWLARVFPGLEDTAEFGKIGRYYAVESMLVWDPARGQYDADATPSYGKDTLEGFYKRVLKEGLEGQELGDQAVFK